MLKLMRPVKIYRSTLRFLTTLPTLLALAALAACGTTSPGAPSDSARSDHPMQVTAADAERAGVTQAEVRFMQGMIVHHAQAVRMAGLVPARSRHESLRTLARRIGISQRDEIALMQRWLRQRGLPAPEPDYVYPWDDGDAAGMAMGGELHTRMAGILSPEQMAQLAAAEGTAFDRLFLRGMIEHHGGALTMVERLLDAPGAAQEPATYELAVGISGLQRSQIARMRALLAALPEQPATDQ